MTQTWIDGCKMMSVSMKDTRIYMYVSNKFFSLLLFSFYLSIVQCPWTHRQVMVRHLSVTNRCSCSWILYTACTSTHCSLLLCLCIATAFPRQSTHYWSIKNTIGFSLIRPGAGVLRAVMIRHPGNACFTFTAWGLPLTPAGSEMSPFLWSFPCELEIFLFSGHFFPFHYGAIFLSFSF